MKIAVISDVHANQPALNAVLDDLTNVDQIIHAGDVIGYNPFPSEVIETFQSKEVISIAGNHDQGVMGHSDFEFPTAAESIINWTLDELSTDQLEYIKDRPTEKIIHVDDQRIQMVHGSLTDNNEYVYPTDLTMEMVKELDDSVDIFVWGHTHYPIVTKINGVLLINPGSVGQPRDGDWRASYAIFDTRTGTVELRRKKYNIDRLVEKAKTESFPQQIIDSLRQPD